MIAKGTLIAAVAFGLASTAHAMCFADVSARSGIPEELLRVIAQVESNMNPRAVNINENGSEDIGLMQINTVNLPALKKLGIHREDLFDPCTNLIAGAWILSQMINKYGFTWEAIGAYNAKSRDKRDRYIGRVYARHMKGRSQNG